MNGYYSRFTPIQCISETAARPQRQAAGWHHSRHLNGSIGNGLVTSEGSYWLRQRRLIQPAFHLKRLAIFSSVMTTAAGEMLDRWQLNATNGQPLDVANEFMRVTLDIVSRSMFSTDVAGFSGEIGQNLPVVLECTNDRVWELVDLSSLPTLRNRRYWMALDDLLTVLLEAVDEEAGERMTDQQLRDEVITIDLAGHETTAKALSWAHTLIPHTPMSQTSCVWGV